MHVVDLACGTGVTTMEILRRLDVRGRVTAVDGAEALLAVARARLTDSRVTWVQARGESLEAAVEEPADAVLCSAAFWQMRWPEAMAAVRSALRTGGVFAFNLPDQFFPALFPERPRPCRRRNWSTGSGCRSSPHAFCPASTTPRAWRSWTRRSTGTSHLVR
jgi:trans-aconitate methyltransferase